MIEIGLLYNNDKSYIVYKQNLVNYLRKMDKTFVKSNSTIKTALLNITFIDTSTRNREKFDTNKFDYLFLFSSSYKNSFVDDDIKEKIFKKESTYNGFYDAMDLIRGFYELKIDIYSVEIGTKVKILKKTCWEQKILANNEFKTKQEAKEYAKKRLQIKNKEIDLQLSYLQKQIDSYKETKERNLQLINEINL